LVKPLGTPHTRVGALLRGGLLGAGMLLCACAGATGHPEVKHHLTGQVFPLEAFRGHVLLVNVWATWCEPCLLEVPELAKLANQFGEQVVLVALHYQQESTARVQVTDWLPKQPAYFSHYVGWGNAAMHDLFPADGLPTTYVIGRGGVVVTRFVGAILTETRRAELRAAIEVGLKQSLAPAPAAVH
jgi:thiol-disulfide isomerase/thioredoxin